ncbi:MAG: hypothetical protein CAF41_011840 [Nitrospira sp. CG24A]|nr:MAG: hypothetical protein CAF41_011840 [Nitrospira sp. CG24A]
MIRRTLLSLYPDKSVARKWPRMKNEIFQDRPSRYLYGAILLLLLLSGCGAILHGGKQEVTFDSKPPGATVTLDNATQFFTPHTMLLSRSSNHHAIFKKDGYDPQRVMIQHHFLVGPSIIGNILPLFPVGFTIDVVTGSAWGFEQDYIAVDLTKAKSQP